MRPKLEEDPMVPEEDIKLKEFKRKTAETKELFGKGKTGKVRPIQYEKTLSVSEEIALELNVQVGLGKVYRKSQTYLQHALSYVDKQENF